jgi:hypothetical protein
MLRPTPRSVKAAITVLHRAVSLPVLKLADEAAGAL